MATLNRASSDISMANFYLLDKGYTLAQLSEDSPEMATARLEAGRKYVIDLLTQNYESIGKALYSAGEAMRSFRYPSVDSTDPKSIMDSIPMVSRLRDMAIDYSQITQDLCPYIKAELPDEEYAFITDKANAFATIIGGLTDYTESFASLPDGDVEIGYSCSTLISGKMIIDQYFPEVCGLPMDTPKVTQSTAWNNRMSSAGAASAMQFIDAKEQTRIQDLILYGGICPIHATEEPNSTDSAFSYEFPEEKAYTDRLKTHTLYSSLADEQKNNVARDHELFFADTVPSDFSPQHSNGLNMTQRETSHVSLARLYMMTEYGLTMEQVLENTPEREAMKVECGRRFADVFFHSDAAPVADPKISEISLPEASVSSPNPDHIRQNVIPTLLKMNQTLQRQAPDLIDYSNPDDVRQKLPVLRALCQANMDFTQSLGSSHKAPANAAAPLTIGAQFYAALAKVEPTLQNQAAIDKAFIASNSNSKAYDVNRQIIESVTKMYTSDSYLRDAPAPTEMVPGNNAYRLMGAGTSALVFSRDPLYQQIFAAKSDYSGFTVDQAEYLRTITSSINQNAREPFDLEGISKDPKSIEDFQNCEAALKEQLRYLKNPAQGLTVLLNPSHEQCAEKARKDLAAQQRIAIDSTSLKEEAIAAGEIKSTASHSHSQPAAESSEHAKQPVASSSTKKI